MITTKNPLPGNLYLVAHSAGIRAVILYIHADGSASSAWRSDSGERIFRFKAFDQPGAVGGLDWLSDVRNSPTWYGVFAGRPGLSPDRITDDEIHEIFKEWGAR